MACPKYLNPGTGIGRTNSGEEEADTGHKSGKHWLGPRYAYERVCAVCVTPHRYVNEEYPLTFPGFT